jgi:hypothetical protein
MLLLVLAILILLLVVYHRDWHLDERFAITNQISYPNQIIIIRHAEKPNSSSNNLSPQGYTRSYQLVNFFQSPISSTYQTPDVVYAQMCQGWNGDPMQCKDSARPIETTTPFATAQGTPFVVKYEITDYSGLIQDVFTNQNAVVLIGWEHTNIPGIINTLFDSFETNDGKVYSSIAGWDYNPFSGTMSNDIYNMAWVFTYNGDGKTYTLNVIPQFNVSSSAPYLVQPFSPTSSITCSSGDVLCGPYTCVLNPSALL